jgi:hypothetical protein
MKYILRASQASWTLLELMKRLRHESTWVFHFIGICAAQPLGGTFTPLTSLACVDHIGRRRSRSVTDAPAPQRLGILLESRVMGGQQRQRKERYG